MEDSVHSRLVQVMCVLGADHHVTELRGFASELVWVVDREGEDICGLVEAAIFAIQGPDVVGSHERDRQMAVRDADGGERRGGGVAELIGARAEELDLDGHARQPVVRPWPRAVRSPTACFSAYSLYAATIRCTSLWRTTSSPPKRTNSIPSTLPRMSPITTSPERWSFGRSICVMSPVTTIFELNPSRVRNIFICSGLVFCASSRMMKLSFSVRPRMNASGATSIVPRSMYWLTRSGSSMS